MTHVLKTEHPSVTTLTLKVHPLESKNDVEGLTISKRREDEASHRPLMKKYEPYSRLGLMGERLIGEELMGDEGLMGKALMDEKLRRLQGIWREERRALKQRPKQSPASTTAALQPEADWTPSEAALQRGRAILEATLHQSHNLSLSEFAQRAHKSSQQIEKDIEARRLLAFDVKPFARKIPDWQLNPIKQQLTRRVLQRAKHIDVWTLYCALSYPLEVLGGRSPVDAVTEKSLDDSVETVLNVLSIH